MNWYEILLKFLLVFVSGGILCAIAEILIIKTTLTPAKILVIFLNTVPRSKSLIRTTRLS